jgi:uncharacterized membrane protein YphA (DoxX/SURF4 family)
MENLIVTLLSLTLGSFFVLARFRFFYDPAKPAGARWFNAQRHESLIHKMTVCGMQHRPVVMAWLVATIEVVGGLLLITGVARWLGALLLLGILLKATICTARAKVCEQKPVDWLDYGCCYLWRVEGLYIVMALCILAASVPL